MDYYTINTQLWNLYILTCTIMDLLFGPNISAPLWMMQLFPQTSFLHKKGMSSIVAN